MRRLIQLRTTPQSRVALAAGDSIPLTATAAEALSPAGLSFDEGYDPVELPAARTQEEDGPGSRSEVRWSSRFAQMTSPS